MIDTLAMRERHRDWYLRNRDPIGADRMRWRAHAFRQLVHLLPGQTILEMGRGEGTFTRQLVYVSRGENPITAVTFDSSAPRSIYNASVTPIVATSLPGPLEGKRFDLIVGMDLLDSRTAAEMLQQAHELLNPGGQLVFFESNPWNVVLRARRAAARVIGRRDPRTLISRRRLYELMSEVGFIRVFAVFTDFVYAPLTRRLVCLLRNLSIVLENMPGARTLAGTILVHAQKPPRVRVPVPASLCEHASLRGAVSVVIPCHNEEMNVRPSSGACASFTTTTCTRSFWSTTTAPTYAEAILSLAAEDPRVHPVLRSPPNGVGRAIADGYRAASGRYVLSMDCDFQHLLPEIPRPFRRRGRGFRCRGRQSLLAAQRAAQLSVPKSSRTADSTRSRSSPCGAAFAT